eukprot:3245569-Pleurochrysis_carterae.AAC.1
MQLSCVSSRARALIRTRVQRLPRSFLEATRSTVGAQGRTYTVRCNSSTHRWDEAMAAASASWVNENPKGQLVRHCSLGSTPASANATFSSFPASLAFCCGGILSFNAALAQLPSPFSLPNFRPVRVYTPFADVPWLLGFLQRRGKCERAHSVNSGKRSSAFMAQFPGVSLKHTCVEV